MKTIITITDYTTYQPNAVSKYSEDELTSAINLTYTLLDAETGGAITDRWDEPSTSEKYLTDAQKAHITNAFLIETQYVLMNGLDFSQGNDQLSLGSFNMSSNRPNRNLISPQALKELQLAGIWYQTDFVQARNGAGRRMTLADEMNEPIWIDNPLPQSVSDRRYVHKQAELSGSYGRFLKYDGQGLMEYVLLTDYLTDYYTKTVIDELLSNKSKVSVSETGTSVEEIGYITVDGVQYKISSIGLPVIVKDRYLHTNAVTGVLEWVAGAGGNYVTIDTTQTVTGEKTFSNYVEFTSDVEFTAPQGSRVIFSNRDTVFNGTTLELNTTVCKRNGSNLLTQADIVDDPTTGGSDKCFSAAQGKGLYDLVNTKQDIISDLATIRSGAALGATAVQPATLGSYYTKTESDAKYVDLTSAQTISGSKNFTGQLFYGGANVLTYNTGIQKSGDTMTGDLKDKNGYYVTGLSTTTYTVNDLLPMSKEALGSGSDTMRVKTFKIQGTVTAGSTLSIPVGQHGSIWFMRGSNAYFGLFTTWDNNLVELKTWTGLTVTHDRTNNCINITNTTSGTLGAFAGIVQTTLN